MFSGFFVLGIFDLSQLPNDNIVVPPGRSTNNWVAGKFIAVPRMLDHNKIGQSIIADISVGG
jgi:hypothetical protein